MLRKFLAGFILLAYVSQGFAHPGHSHHEHEHEEAKKPEPTFVALNQAPKPQTVDGQGLWKFTWRKDLSQLPVKPEVLLQAHGGFAVDRSVPVNERTTVFGLPTVGALRISGDLATIEVKGGPFEGHNLHNAGIFHMADTKYYAFPGNAAGKVWITDTNFNPVRTFGKPDHAEKWAPTDVEVAAGLLLVPSGYGDRKIYNADPLSGEVDTGVWNPGSWGGRGPSGKPGLFSTSHGITLIPGKRALVTISDREHGQLQTFQPDGTFESMIKIDGTPHPCDIDYDESGRYAVVGCLKDVGGKTPAPFYILDGGKVVSKVIPASLGVPNSRHIHNACFRFLKDEEGRERCFVICLFWNPGGYAVFERVEQWHAKPVTPAS